MVSKVVTKKALLEGMTVAEAMDHLTSMAGLTKESLKNQKKPSKEIAKWFDPQDDVATLHNIKMTFKVLLDYLKEVQKKDKEKIQNVETQQGVQSLMTLAAEAVRKLDRYTSLIERGMLQESVAELKEYQALQEFYQKKTLKKFQKEVGKGDLWKEEWGDDHNLAVNERGLKDLEAVKSDKQYELLYIKKEDGSRFFGRNLLRHIKLVNDFDQMVVSTEHEDPFIFLQRVQDRNAYESAKEIKNKLQGHMNQLIKLLSPKQDSECIDKILKSFYALCLASSQHSLLESGSKKSAFQYFEDFSTFLIEVFMSTDYQAHKDDAFEELDKVLEEMLLCAYQMCENWFMHVGPKDQMIGLMNRLMDKIGVGEKTKVRPATQMWTGLQDEYNHLSNVLQKYPNGPLFKTLDVFISANTEAAFEPLAQGNRPSLLYTIKNETLGMSVLRLPSPTKQEVINKAEISHIFESFMRAMTTLHSKQNLLLINLQDRTSWQEHARCQVLEEMQKLSTFAGHLQVCTLAKETSFYLQSEDYHDINSAEDFKKLLLQQIVDAEECGFYFPKEFSQTVLTSFAKECIELIHDHFFGGKATLPHKNRLDFIEIFYFFLTLKMIDFFKPSHLALSCKDAIDTSPASYAGLFAFLKLMSPDDEWSREEEDFLTWMMQAPALLYRERAMHADRYERTVSALNVLSAELAVDKRKTLAAFEKLYGYSIFKTINVREAKS